MKKKQLKMFDKWGMLTSDKSRKVYDKVEKIVYDLLCQLVEKEGVTLVEAETAITHATTIAAHNAVNRLAKPIIVVECKSCRGKGFSEPPAYCRTCNGDGYTARTRKETSKK